MSLRECGIIRLMIKIIGNIRNSHPSKRILVISRAGEGDGKIKEGIPGKGSEGKIPEEGPLIPLVNKEPRKRKKKEKKEKDKRKQQFVDYYYLSTRNQCCPSQLAESKARLREMMEIKEL